MTTRNAGAAAPSGVTAEHRLAAMIDAWFVELIHNSPVSRDTEAFNHCRRAVEALKRRLLGEI